MLSRSVFTATSQFPKIRSLQKDLMLTSLASASGSPKAFSSRQSKKLKALVKEKKETTFYKTMIKVYEAHNANLQRQNVEPEPEKKMDPEVEAQNVLLMYSIDSLSLSDLEHILHPIESFDFAQRLPKNLIRFFSYEQVHKDVTETDPNFRRFHHAELASEHIRDLVKQTLHEKFEFKREVMNSFLWKENTLLLVKPLRRPGGSGDQGLEIASTPEEMMETTSIEIPKLKMVMFSSAQELKQLLESGQHEDTLFLPQIENFPTIDWVVYTGGQVFLMNASWSSKGHLYALGFRQFTKNSGLDQLETLPMFWVVPSEKMFDEFRPTMLSGELVQCVARVP